MVAFPHTLLRYRKEILVISTRELCCTFLRPRVNLLRRSLQTQISLQQSKLAAAVWKSGPFLSRQISGSSNNEVGRVEEQYIQAKCQKIQTFHNSLFAFSLPKRIDIVAVGLIMTRSTDSRQDALRVLGLYLPICEGLAIVTRLVLKKVVIGARGLDDLLAVFSLVFSIISGITATLAAEQGLGQANLGVANAQQIQKLQQFVYVSEIFHVLCQCLIRMSILLLVKQIFSLRTKSWYFDIAFVVIILWGLASTLVVALQCQIPEPWNLAQGSCLNMGLFWTIFNSIEIIIDVTIVSLPTWLSWHLNMSIRRKMTVFVYFTPWVGTIAVASVSIAYAHYFNEANKATPIVIGTAIWPWFVCAQVLRALSIISTCIPYLRPLIEAFPSGLYQTDEIRRRGINYTDFKHGFTVSESSGSGSQTYYLRERNSGSQ